MEKLLSLITIAGREKYYRWLSELRMNFPVQQIVLEEHRDAVMQAEERVKGLEEEMRKALTT
jgi:hypothetical protein